MLRIIGWYGERNVGDEAFRLVFEQELKDYELSFGQKPDSTCKATIYGGGGVTVGGYLDNLNSTNHAPKFAVGVDLACNGPDYTRFASFAWNHVYARSKEHVYYNTGILKKKVSYCPDIVFGWDHKDISHVVGQNKKLGITLTKDGFPEFNDFYVDGLRHAKARGYKIVFINFHTTRRSGGMPDEAFATFTSRRVPLDEGDYTIVNCEDAQQALEEIASCGLYWTQRFHGTILAIMANTPYLALARFGKQSLLHEQEGIQEHYQYLDALNIFKLLQSFEMTSSPEVIAKLHRVASQNKIAVKNMFVEFRGKLESALNMFR